MLEVDWTAEEGWGAPKISPYHNLSVDPAASVFHYALEVCLPSALPFLFHLLCIALKKTYKQPFVVL
jgi:hypothetical protein